MAIFIPGVSFLTYFLNCSKLSVQKFILSFFSLFYFPLNSLKITQQINPLRIKSYVLLDLCLELFFLSVKQLDKFNFLLALLCLLSACLGLNELLFKLTVLFLVEFNVLFQLFKFHVWTKFDSNKYHLEGLAWKWPVKHSCTYLFTLYQAITQKALQDIFDWREWNSSLNG